jgi:para-aminobenzoate synthetase component I
LNSPSPWYWRSLPLKNRTGSEIFARLFLNPDKIATLLESPVTEPPKQDKLSRYSICAGSPRQVDGKLQLWTPSLGKILPFLRSLLTIPTAIAPEIEHLPFTGGWLGWLGYDLAWEIERLPNFNDDSLPFPIAYWYEPADFAVLDHQKQLLWLAASVPEELDRLEDKLTKISLSSPAEALFLKRLHNTLRRPLPPLTFVTSQIDYENSVRQALKYIQDGDIFQTNLSLRFETQTSADSWSIYRALQRINPSPFASYWQTPWGAVISCSPERLIQLQGNHAQTRPIAGTRSRGANLESDRKIAEEFIVNFKERAEHIMLVDLERNDLGKVCQWGSVKVDELLSIERYSHVMHLVSNVIGNLRSEFDAIDLIRATFPGGTITGCPKVRCLEIIEELEPVRRNLFYGSCGYLDRRGWLDLNILIRTLLYSKPSFSLARVWGQVGAGIVADSDPSQEWHESLNKAEAQLAALQLFS